MGRSVHSCLCRSIVGPTVAVHFPHISTYFPISSHRRPDGDSPLLVTIQFPLSGHQRADTCGLLGAFDFPHIFHRQASIGLTVVGRWVPSISHIFSTIGLPPSGRQWLDGRSSTVVALRGSSQHGMTYCVSVGIFDTFRLLGRF